MKPKSDNTRLGGRFFSHARLVRCVQLPAPEGWLDEVVT